MDITRDWTETTHTIPCVPINNQISTVYPEHHFLFFSAAAPLLRFPPRPDPTRDSAACRRERRGTRVRTASLGPKSRRRAEEHLRERATERVGRSGPSQTTPDRYLSMPLSFVLLPDARKTTSDFGDTTGRNARDRQTPSTTSESPARPVGGAGVLVFNCLCFKVVPDSRGSHGVFRQFFATTFLLFLLP